MRLNKTVLTSVSVVALACAVSRAANSDIKITEVDPNGSSTATYSSDWFELTNTGTSLVDITGWKIDDSSALFSAAVPFRLVTSINPGQTVVFFEGNTSGSTDTTKITAFETAWFGATVPAGFTIGAYGGSGVGLSSTAPGDAVNIYDSLGNLVTGVTFGATAAGATLDNPTGASGAISATSVAGTNGAFLSADGTETGSPGVAPTPEPASLSVIGFGAMALLSRRRKIGR